MTNIWIAGVDEAGRGPLAGPVVAAAVILDPARPIAGLRDSKQLSERQREVLFGLITERALAWSLGRAEASEIDAINILQATMRAMQRAVAGLSVRPALVQVDGNRCPRFDIPTEAIVKGDSKVVAISAASILAKVTRDREMQLLHQRYPEYGFNQHKGYPTAAHRARLREFGAAECHRRSFRPVAEALAEGGERSAPDTVSRS
ncbi:MAG: ribonuclease HII [Thiotrichales bacterium]